MNAKRSASQKFQGKHSEATSKIIGVFYAVYNELGYGFSEKVYENAMVIRLRKADLSVQQQVPIPVYFDGQIVGQYVADLLVNKAVLLELKAVRRLLPEHEAQLLNYLKATLIEVGLLLNFGPRAEFKRMVFDNDRKGTLSWAASASEHQQNP
jgi:GxxExxY protein